MAMNIVSQENKKGLRNPWFLGMLALIVVVLAVNGAFIWYATHNQSSLVDREYKTKDRKTNAEMLSELRAQQVLAWQTTIKRPKAVILNAPAEYQISVVDRDGKPVTGILEVEAYRASDASKDFTTEFKEVASGVYQGYISFPLKGYWELRLHLTRGEDDFRVDTERFKVLETAP